MSLIDHVKRELAFAGYTPDSTDMELELYNNVVELTEVFVKQGHSGYSAPLILSLFNDLARWKPVTPLKGTDDEWTHIAEDDGGVYQNKRQSNIFKRGKEGTAYWLDGTIFFDMFWSKEEQKFVKTYFTNKNSRVDVHFPWTEPAKQYVFTNEYYDEDSNLLTGADLEQYLEIHRQHLNND